MNSSWLENCQPAGSLHVAGHGPSYVHGPMRRAYGHTRRMRQRMTHAAIPDTCGHVRQTWPYQAHAAMCDAYGHNRCMRLFVTHAAVPDACGQV
eukprot:366561-Chlamydomonas_euryale.AAC.6